MDKVTSLLKEVIQSFVDHPDEVKLTVNERQEDDGTLYEVIIDVNESDRGICIGKGGENAEALRKIGSMIGFKHFSKPIYVRIKTSVKYNK